MFIFSYVKRCDINHIYYFNSDYIIKISFDFEEGIFVGIGMGIAISWIICLGLFGVCIGTTKLIMSGIEETDTQELKKLNEQLND